MATDNLMPQSSTSVIKHFMLRSSTTGQGLTGKVHSDFSGKYNIAGGVEVTLSFSSGTAGDAYSSGKIVPLGLGKYAWHVPNAVFASLGNVSAVLSVTGGIDVHCEWLVVADSRDLATKPVNVTQFGGTNGTFASGVPDVKVASMAANALTAAAISADAGAELAALVETYIVNEGDATAVMQAIADKIAADWVAGDASPLAVATAVWANATRTITGGSLTTSPPTAAAIADAVWNESRSGHTTDGTFGFYVDAAITSRLAPTVSGRTLNINTDGAGDAVLDATTQTQINNIETGTNTLLSRVTTTVVTLWANLTAMITGSGASAKYTTGALSNAPGSEATISQEGLDTIIAGVQAVHLNITEAVENCGFSITSSDTWIQSVTGLGDLTDKKVTFTIKSDRRDVDSAAIVFIDEAIGLLYLNGAVTTTSWGSITIDDENAGDITLRLESNATKLIPAGKYIDAIKVIKDNADFSLRNAGTTTVLCGVIKEIS